MAAGDPIEHSLYVYAPNKVAPIVWTSLYTLSTVAHTYQCYRYRTFKLAGLQPFCAGLFSLGYALRIYGSYHYTYTGTETNTLIIYILSQVFIYIAPPLLELANYHVLGRAFLYIPHYAPLPPGQVLSIFGGLMLVVETLNALGVALASNPGAELSSQRLGSMLTRAALGMQLAVIAIFVFMAVWWHWKCATRKVLPEKLRALLFTLYASMLLILVRCVYRLIEHLGDTSIDVDDLEKLKKLTPILRYEWWFFVFDSTLMLLNSILWNIWNPGRYIVSNPRLYLDKDGITELLREPQADQRSVWQKCANLATFGIFWRKNKYREIVAHEMSPANTGT